jgi:hypothetical protein
MFTMDEALSVTIAENFFGSTAIMTHSISSSMTLAV